MGVPTAIGGDLRGGKQCCQLRAELRTRKAKMPITAGTTEAYAQLTAERVIETRSFKVNEECQAVGFAPPYAR
jgi:hypothetical protein